MKSTFDFPISKDTTFSVPFYWFLSYLIDKSINTKQCNPFCLILDVFRILFCGSANRKKSSCLSVISFISVLQRYDSTVVVTNVYLPFITEIKIYCKMLF